MHSSVGGRHFLKKLQIYATTVGYIRRSWHSLNNSKCTLSVRRIDRTKGKPSKLVKGHSLNNSKCTPIVRRIDRTKGKPSKLVKGQEVAPKIYMRDTITRISNALRYSTWDSAQEQLDKLGLKWDSFTVNQVLKTHPPMEKAWLFFNWASRQRGFKHDQFTYTTMMDIFGEAKRISSMEHLFQQMQEKGIKIDTVTYTSAIHWTSNAGDVEGAIKLWEEMRARECRPTVVSYTAYMKILFDHNRVKEATEIYKEMLEAGCPPNCYTYTVLMKHLASSGRFSKVMEIFNNMQEAGVYPDKAACNIMVEKCCVAGETEVLLKILSYMREQSLVLRHPVYLLALETLQASGVSDVLLRQVNRHSSVKSFEKLEHNNFSAAICDSISGKDQALFIHLLSKQNLVSIDRLLGDLSTESTKLDSGVISMIIEVNCSQSRQAGALLAFEYSIKQGLDVERVSYLALLGLLLRSRLYSKVFAVVDAMIKARMSLATHLSALLVYKLGCSKDTASAVKVFNALPMDHKSSATYTALMSAYFNSGNVEKGLETFETMKREEVRVALGTYNVLLYGLEKAGRVQDCDIFKKEKKILKARSFSLNACKEEKLCNHIFAGEVNF